MDQGSGYWLGVCLGLAGVLVVWLLRHVVALGLLALGVAAWVTGPLWLAGYLAVLVGLWLSGVAGQARRRTQAAGGSGMVTLLLAGAATGWLVSHPFVLFTVAGTVFFTVTLWPYGPVVWWVFLGCLIWAWRDLHPRSWGAVVPGRWWTTWREFGYRARWRKAMLAARLGGVLDGVEVLPMPVRIRSSRWRDEVTVRLAPAQTLEDWERRSAALASAFRAARCSVGPLVDGRGRTRPGFVQLVFVRGDALAEVLQPPVADLGDLFEPVGGDGHG